MHLDSDQPKRAARASTGPRPLGRGMKPTRRLARSTSLGFNGATPAWAWNARATCPRSMRPRPASTGPRPRGRGMNASSRDFGRQLTASTGPRPRGRGMLPWPRERRPQKEASTGPRPRGRGMDADAGGELGADDASTGPRPRGRGMWMKFTTGREGLWRFNGATPTRAWNEDLEAQERREAEKLLQRGHAHAGVEWPPSGPMSHETIACFNGATPTRAWNGH